ncbi:MAG: IS1 family transposase [Chloroflexota bacterium]|nr:IS1 family transposase [Chloroflexota bacterium]
MNSPSTGERAGVVRALVEGNSLRAAARMTGTSINTVTLVQVALGRAADDYQGRVLRGLPCKRIQCDEIWAFFYAKRTHLPKVKKAPEGAGDVWTWVAICQDTKIVPTWHIDGRTPQDARLFMADLALRIASRPQITTDGLPQYVQAIFAAFGKEVDFAQVIKVYANQDSGRYSPAVCVGAHAQTMIGSPDPLWVSTSYVERQNLTMRMGMRRLTRLTNAFSKKVANLEAAVGLYYMHYNFGRVHQTIKKTPAMAAGVGDHRWTAEEIATLLDDPKYAAVFRDAKVGAKVA